MNATSRDQKAPLQTGFHVSVEARDRFALNDLSFTVGGAIAIQGFYAARLVAHRANNARHPMTPPAQAGKINALGTITGILRFVFDLYSRTINPDIVENATLWLENSLGREAYKKVLTAFIERFDPTRRLRGDQRLLVREMLLLWLENQNPAASSMASLFDDTSLREYSAYGKLVPSLEAFFDHQPPFGPRKLSLVDLLGSPVRAEPESLARQLEYIRREWASLLGEHLLHLLSAMDLLNEEEKARIAGPAPPQAMQLDALEDEPENYSHDTDWMPNLVLVAKNVLVWLWQLSSRYGREIKRLDQIPEEELETLARRGVTGIWLIGVWERSPVSKRIKEIVGNVDATSSAYSIFMYTVAEDLGGGDALGMLREKAWSFGIRLGADMVPNHTGIYSKWIIEHPDWFVSAHSCPFPSYSYHGENLSRDERAEIYLEDHYYDRTDAAVVFKLVHRDTEEVRYVYHGNDGTVMPWNDTAQLNYLNADVRSAVIDTILHVAGQFPIIRFDAAMTLTKMHYQRLWFPEPGAGGAVPSRAEYGLTKAEFNEAMPQELWREVVDRVALERPDTLLLAEAFWLTEGFFVRTLGMHRVYNSAFMNMLREEDNAGYRKLVKDTLAFDPEILKRYVNFMNNPDEETAVVQFGKDGKYFGICTMMATMPGLPMIGHGQFEGFAEKYGAEYRRPWLDEPTDEALVGRHEREIVPLLKKRYLFSGVSNFAFYDVLTQDGTVDENVFAYSNRIDDQGALVIYHNKWGDTTGSVRTSVPSLHKRSDGQREHRSMSLAEGLGCSNDPDSFLLFRDHVAGLEYIRSTGELRAQGLTVRLGAYSYHVFLDFNEIHDDGEQTYARLAAYLNGAGTTDLESTRVDMLLQPVHQELYALLNPALVGALPDRAAGDQFASHLSAVLNHIRDYLRITHDVSSFAVRAREELFSLLPQSATVSREKRPDPKEQRLPGLSSCAKTCQTPLLAAYLTFRAVTQFLHISSESSAGGHWLNELRMNAPFQKALAASGVEKEYADLFVDLAMVLERFAHTIIEVAASRCLGSLFEKTLNEKEMNRILEINEHEGTIWFSKERLHWVLCWLSLTAYLEAQPADRSVTATSWSERIEHTMALAEAAGFRLFDFVASLKEPESQTNGEQG